MYLNRATPLPVAPRHWALELSMGPTESPWTHQYMCTLYVLSCTMPGPACHWWHWQAGCLPLQVEGKLPWVTTLRVWVTQRDSPGLHVGRTVGAAAASGVCMHTLYVISFATVTCRCCRPGAGTRDGPLAINAQASIVGLGRHCQWHAAPRCCHGHVVGIHYRVNEIRVADQWIPSHAAPDAVAGSHHMYVHVYTLYRYSACAGPVPQLGPPL